MVDYMRAVELSLVDALAVRKQNLQAATGSQVPGSDTIFRACAYLHAPKSNIQSHRVC